MVDAVEAGLGLGAGRTDHIDGGRAEVARGAVAPVDVVVEQLRGAVRLGERVGRIVEARIGDRADVGDRQRRPFIDRLRDRGGGERGTTLLTVTVRVSWT